jgi:hypothetical protein
MTLNLKIDPALERRLREQAASRGIRPDSYAVAAIQEQLRRDGFEPPQLSEDESTLLQEIASGFSNEVWNRFDALTAKRQRGTLTRDELEELTGLSDQLEEQNVRRIETLLRLASLRNTSLEALMDELQIKPHARRGE